MFNVTNKKKMKQLTNTIMMIEPVAFRYNEQTAENNYYQKILDNLTPKNIQERALLEFNNFVFLVLYIPNKSVNYSKNKYLNFL